MSIDVRLSGDNNQSDEYNAACYLKDRIEETAPAKAIGEIVLYPNATLFGQEIKDIDLIMIGSIRNCLFDLEVEKDDGWGKETVSVESFCACVEIKSHSISGVNRKGTDWYVKYKNTDHNVTYQSNKQKESMKSFLNRALGDTPYITNLIWFTGVFPDDIKELTKTDERHEVFTNVFGSEFDFKDIIQLIAYQRIPKYYRGAYHLESGFSGSGVDKFQKAFDLFEVSKRSMGSLTRKKVEQITQQALNNTISTTPEKFTVLRGRAGTGKTIQLINTALRLIDEEEARVLILTYNRALVSDIRRLFALAKLPDMFNEKCVAIMTMQSFFFHLINECIKDGSLSGKEFLDNYEKLISEMLALVKKDEEARDIVHMVCAEKDNLNWDYLLIDEGQDWSVDERDLVLELFEKKHIITADGGQQFVRNIEPCNWSIIKEKNNIRLKQCLRQKNNLIKFVNHFMDEFDYSSKHIISSEKMPGGNVIVITNPKKIIPVLRDVNNKMIRDGNIAYDMLLMVNRELVGKNGSKHFKLKSEFENNGLLIWDGTVDNNRLEYSVDPDEIRVIQYESARGLEGWAVGCINFDTFLSSKEQLSTQLDHVNSLVLESIEEKQKKYVLNWAMIPLTRPIDTLIISLEDKDSNYSRIILKLARRYSDYVTIID